MQFTHRAQVVKGRSSNAIGEIICQNAEDLSARLLVMTANKRGGVGAFYEGSHVQYCLQNCSTTVLVWRPDWS